MHMTCMRACLAVLVVAASCAAPALAAPKSRFNRDINEHALEEQYKDPESEEWHEDTPEWDMKRMQERTKPVDIEALQATIKSQGMAKAREDMMANAMDGYEMHMVFVSIKKSAAKNDEELTVIGKRWATLLNTNGVKVVFYSAGGNDLLFTENGGRMREFRDFVLNQPETEKFRFKDVDYTPTPAPTLTPEEKAQRRRDRKAAKARAKAKEQAREAERLAALAAAKAAAEEKAAREAADAAGAVDGAGAAPVPVVASSASPLPSATPAPAMKSDL